MKGSVGIVPSTTTKGLPLFMGGFERHKTLGICILKYFYWLLSPRVVGTLLKVPIQN